MKDGSSSFDMSLKGIFQLDQLFRVQQMQLITSIQSFLNGKPDLSWSIVVPCLQGKLSNVFVCTTFHHFTRQFLLKRCGEIGTIGRIKCGFKVKALRVRDSHEISFAESVEVMNGNWILSPQRIWLFLHKPVATSSISSTMPRRTLFLYSSKICLSSNSSSSGSSLKLMKLCLGISGTRLLGLEQERLRRESSGLMSLLWSLRQMKRGEMERWRSDLQPCTNLPYNIIILFLTPFKYQSMSFSIGVLLGVIFKRNRKPRLVLFREELKRRPKEVVTLVQYPAKQLFCILCIILFVAVMHWLQNQLQSELQERSERIGQLFALDTDQKILIAKQSGEQGKIAIDLEIDKAVGRTRIAFIIIYACSVASIIVLFCSLTLRKVLTTKRGKYIKTATFKNLGLQVKHDTYYLQEGDRLQIWEMGESRFTHTNYYYSIRIINKQGSWQIIRKSNIFSSRIAVLQIAELHSLPHSTKILKKELNECQL